MKRARLIAVATLIAAFVLGAILLAVPAGASTSGGGAHATLAQVTVDPNAPARNFPETQDKPWTLLMGKALLPLVIVLILFVIGWYVWKMARVRHPRT